MSKHRAPRRAASPLLPDEHFHEASLPGPALSVIDSVQRRAASSPGIISFAGGLPNQELFPRRELSRAFISAVARPDGGALQYGWPEGSLALREYVARELRQRGAHVSPDRVLITSGAQQALALAAQVTLKAGASVGVDRESYPGALELFRGRNLRLCDPEQEAPAALYCMPALANPRGQVADEAARARWVQWAREHRAFLFEDDAYAETRFDGRVTPPLLASAPERTFHIGTFSKTLCPGLRVGWLVPPERYLKRVLRAKQNSDLQANSLAQSLLEHYLERGSFEALKQRARRVYRRRAERVCELLRKHLPELRFEEPRGGFSVWLEGSAEGSDTRLLELAVESGVSFDPGSAFRSVPAERIALRLCYSALPEEQIEPGIRRLARVFRDWCSESKPERLSSGSAVSGTVAVLSNARARAVAPRRAASARRSA